MVNHSININKMNYNLSPQLIVYKKKIHAYDVGNTGPGLGQAQK